MFKILLVFLTSLTIISQNLLAEEVIIEEAPVVVVEEDFQEIVIVDSNGSETEPISYTEEELELLRESHGITELSAHGSDEYKLYAFRGEGSLAISNITYSNAVEAQNFCQSLTKDGKEFFLISPKAGLGVTFLGMPFSILLDTSYVYKPVIHIDGKRTGAVFWTTGFEDSIDDNSVYTFTDGNGAGGGGPQELDSLNERLVEVGLEELSLPAICLDKSLKTYLD